MRKDTRKFLITVEDSVYAREVQAEDFDMYIQDLLEWGYDLDVIQVWVEGNFRLIPERFEVD